MTIDILALDETIAHIQIHQISTWDNLYSTSDEPYARIHFVFLDGALSGKLGELEIGKTELKQIGITL